MAIHEAFGQAVIGTAAADAEAVLPQILRDEINLVTAYQPLHAETETYLRGLGIRKNFIEAQRGADSGYGRDVARFFYTPQEGRIEASTDNVLPDMPGYDALLDDIAARAARMAAICRTPVTAMIRFLDNEKDFLVTHVDNNVKYRGLQTLIGDGQTLWLPDYYVDVNNWHREYDEDGKLVLNGLKTTFEDCARHRQIDAHHMSIHKGYACPNPLFHSAIANIPELGFRVGERAILTLDMVY